VARARQLGLQGEALRDVVEGLLGSGEREARPGRAKGEAR
jgi:hypothetical protein